MSLCNLFHCQNFTFLLLPLLLRNLSAYNHHKHLLCLCRQRGIISYSTEISLSRCSRFGESYCGCCLSLLPKLACSIHATWCIDSSRSLQSQMRSGSRRFSCTDVRTGNVAEEFIFRDFIAAIGLLVWPMRRRRRRWRRKAAVEPKQGEIEKST